MLVRKWDPFAGHYNFVEINDTWYISIYEKDMATEVRCPSCGRILPFGDTYTSLEYHTMLGMGFGVCESCYNQEVIRRLGAESSRAEA